MTTASLRPVFEMQAQISRSLADAKRLMLLHELQPGERTVNDLANSLGLRQANVSQHLAVLRDKGLVRSRREGTNVYYRLASPKIAQACDLMREVLIEQLQSDRTLAGQVLQLEQAALARALADFLGQSSATPSRPLAMPAEPTSPESR